jgi:hypothetical protein
MFIIEIHVPSQESEQSCNTKAEEKKKDKKVL